MLEKKLCSKHLYT